MAALIKTDLTVRSQCAARDGGSEEQRKGIGSVRLYEEEGQAKQSSGEQEAQV